MKPLDVLDIKAFLVALSQLDSLDAVSQAKLKEIGSIVPLNIDRLNEFAEKHPRLSPLYEAAHLHLGGSTSKNSKGGKPQVNEDAENRTPEEQNVSSDFDDWDKVTKDILTSPDPVKAAQNSEAVKSLEAIQSSEFMTQLF